GVGGKGESALVLNTPNVCRLSDTDGDGKADKKEVLYATYGFADTHGMTNSFTWGFDGWVYACHGFYNSSTVKGADGRPISMQSGNTYRMRPDGSHLEQWTWGQVNPFGICFDPLGNLWSADCHTQPIYQLLRGAYYPSFGKPHDGLGFAPETISRYDDSTAIAGITYYAADHFPPAYRGSDGKIKPLAPVQDLTKASIETLAADLGHPNLTVRTLAANQLVEGGPAGARAVKAVMRPESAPFQRLHGLWVLERAASLDD